MVCVNSVICACLTHVHHACCGHVGCRGLEHALRMRCSHQATNQRSTELQPCKLLRSLTNEGAQQLQRIKGHASPKAVAALEESCKHCSILTAAVEEPACTVYDERCAAFQPEYCLLLYWSVLTSSAEWAARHRAPSHVFINELSRCATWSSCSTFAHKMGFRDSTHSSAGRH
jgi:hypothetical protein